jgi:hypothetical protein
MNWVTGLLVYVVVWWIAFFMVLPWGVKVPDEPEPGHASSAPDRPMLWRKALGDRGPGLGRDLRRDRKRALVLETGLMGRV